MPMRILQMRVQLSLASVLALGLVFSWLLFEKGRLVTELQVKFARDQTEFFTEMVAKATALKDREKVEEIRGYVAWYYPSGTKQKKDSDLDKIVESARRSAFATIDAHLKTL
jgi:hypothetical protein